MIERYHLYCHNGKARFLDLNLVPDTKINGNECIILTEKLLKEWDEKATEVVECETINDATYDSNGNCIYGADELMQLSIIRVSHPNGSVTIEPPYKLFNLAGGLGVLRNSLLVYEDETKNLREMMDKEEEYTTDALLHMYCRKFDVNVMQAKARTFDYTAKMWVDVIGDKIDDDFCWHWEP